ncbi:P2Y purinoceptor 13-like [Sardina pilchardus]|uniref:P2Y purinoceptor 13-like n=1 Tax=Sardina pilchardus TaxID=27697 RepID=UPI002E0E4B5F
MNALEYTGPSPAQEDCGIDKDVVTKILAGLFFLLCVPALVLNVTVLWILLRLRTESTFMVYLQNLVAADLLMTLVLPVRTASDLPGAPLGLRAFTCRYGSVLFYYCMYISIVLMGLISLDRFFKVVRPEVCGSRLHQSLLFGRVVSAATWVVLLATAVLPTIALTSREPSDTSLEFCMEMKTQAGRDFHQALNLAVNCLFWIVLVVIGFCYVCIGWKVMRSYRRSGSTNQERKRKTKVKVFIVLVVFLVCFAPYHIIRIPYTLLQVEKHSCIRESLRVAKEFTLWLSATNICLDPLIYFFLCRSFREKLSDLGILRRFSISPSGSDEESNDQ